MTGIPESFAGLPLAGEVTATEPVEGETLTWPTSEDPAVIE